MRQEFAKEWKRKLFHILLGAALIFLFWQDSIGAQTLAAILLVGVIVSGAFMVRRFKVIAWFLELFDRIEIIPGRGALTFIAGLALAAALFPKNIALAAMAIVTFADAAAAIAGTIWGRRANPLNRSKTIEGSVAFLLFAFISSWLFVPAVGAYSAAITGTLVEAALPSASQRSIWLRLVLDDNLLIPLIVGLSLLIVTSI